MPPPDDTAPDAPPAAPRVLRGVALALATAVAAVALLAAALAAAGYDAPAALAALWRGSVGTPDALASATLVRAVPLLLAGLAVALAFRAGVLNVGAEGQLLAGAAAAASLGIAAGDGLGRAAPIALLLAAAAAGASWAAPAAWLRARFGALEVISTIMLNFVALHLVGFLVRGPLQEPLRIYPQSDVLPEVARLPAVVPGTRLHLGLLLAIAAALVVWWVLARTAAGFRVRVAGANPHAAASAGGVDVRRVTTRAFLASGALAGLAGGVEVMGVTYALYENLSPGYGYTAIAVALLARLHPLGVVGTAVLFGALEAGATAMQRDAGVPSTVAAVVAAAIVLAVVAAAAVRRPAPAREDPPTPLPAEAAA
ncbi:MAG TPA: ABC transporter permease [Gemmatimonadaceae bacterium]|nr:ABC transporter permease [Gemmatimonadaceae bacterium]